MDLSSSIVAERTLAIIKPDASGRENEILAKIEKDGFTILQKKRLQLSTEQASEFYQEHAGKPFYAGLIAFMTSGPVVTLVLAKVGAIKAWREAMGPTDSNKARTTNPDSIRALFGTDNRRNAVHGSDSPESAAREIRFFFPSTIIEPLPSKEEVREYLERGVYGTLTEGLTELSKEKPADPVQWLGKWLLQNNPNQPRIIEPTN